MVSDGANDSAQFFVVGKYRTAITESSQIFRREKRITRNITDGSGFCAGTVSKNVISAQRLAHVFNNIQSVLTCNFHYFFHRCTLSVQMNRDNCPGFRRNFLFQLFRRNIECARVNIGQNRFQLQQNQNFER